MSHVKELDEVFSLVENLCTAEQVRDLLRTRKGNENIRISAEDKETLVRRNLRTAVETKAVEIEKVYDLIRLSAGKMVRNSFCCPVTGFRLIAGETHPSSVLMPLYGSIPSAFKRASIALTRVLRTGRVSACTRSSIVYLLLSRLRLMCSTMEIGLSVSKRRLLPSVAAYMLIAVLSASDSGFTPKNANADENPFGFSSACSFANVC
jgi:hypothetical protein